MSISPAPRRAICFIDGSNFYHGLKAAGVHNQGSLSFSKLCAKACGTHQLLEVRYYVGRLRQTQNNSLYAAQRSFVQRQQNLDSRISFHFGRMEERQAGDAMARELKEFLVRRQDLEAETRKELSLIVTRNASARVHVEKAVDVMLAVDLVILAENDAYDSAYVFSADGDYTHAVDFVRSRGKNVFAVSASSGAALAARVNSFIPIDATWVQDCYI